MPLNRRGSVSARFSVWFFAGERAAKRLDVDLEDLEAARVVLAKRRLALDQVERRPLLRAELGERQRAFRKIERGQRIAAAELGGRLFPVQAPVDHQVQDEPQVVLEAERDALAEAAQPADVFAIERADRRLRRAQQERTGQAHARQAADPGCAAPALRCTGRRRAAPAWAGFSHARAAVPSRSGLGLPRAAGALTHFCHARS